MPVVVVSSACTDGTFSCAGPFPLLQVWVSLGQGGMVLLKLIFVKGLRCVLMLF